MSAIEAYASALHEMVDGPPAPEVAHAQRIVPISNRENSRRMSERDIKARFDLQFTTEENIGLWATADVMSVDSMANPMVRRILRMRCRHAFHNNAYAIGAGNRLAKFVIGSGPKLHIKGDRALTEPVERSFMRWSKAVALPRKLRVSRAARFYNGEGFNVLRTNPKVKHPVKLDLFEIEADRVSSPLYGMIPGAYSYDGCILDPFGNKETYQILREHPGAYGAVMTQGLAFDPVAAAYVLHDYGRIRPEQQRGIPDMAPVAQKYEQLRRYDAAELAAAETASQWAGFIKQAAPDQPDQADTGWGAEMDYVDVRARQMGVLPGGAEAYQMKAEHPTKGHSEYVNSILIEVSQVIDMPLFILTGDARLANMASAYVVTQTFVESVECDREEYGQLMNQTFDEWLPEARRVPGLIPDDFPDDPEYTWRWDRVSNHADPLKMAGAMTARLKNGESPSSVWAREGEDFSEMAARAAQDYGVPESEFRAAYFQATFATRGTPPPASLDPETGDTPDTDKADDSEEDDA